MESRWRRVVRCCGEWDREKESVCMCELFV